MSLLFGFGNGWAEEIVIPKQNFLQLMAGVDHQKKSLKAMTEQNGVLLKIKDEYGKLIEVHKTQLEECEKIVREHEKLGETQEQIVVALEAELKKEKRYRRYQSEATVGLVIVGVVLWLVN